MTNTVYRLQNNYHYRFIGKFFYRASLHCQTLGSAIAFFAFGYHPKTIFSSQVITCITIFLQFYTDLTKLHISSCRLVKSRGIHFSYFVGFRTSKDKNGTLIGSFCSPSICQSKPFFQVCVEVSS